MTSRVSTGISPGRLQDQTVHRRFVSLPVEYLSESPYQLVPNSRKEIRAHMQTYMLRAELINIFHPEKPHARFRLVGQN
jgi:hypothetical protein